MILRNEVAPFGMSVCVIEPGPFRTEFRASGIYSVVDPGMHGAAAETMAYMREHPHDQVGGPARGGD